MSGVLALSYRPTTFAQVVGQHHIKPILKAMITTGQVPPALVFSGTKGTGKTTCARIFAAALNCQQRVSGDACGSCVQCLSVQGSRSTSVLEIDAASSGGVEEVRKIKDLCLYAHDAEWRVVLLDEAHSMSKEAYNALLKLLEEPPAKTVFILVTTEPDKILGTVRSRSMPFEFRRINPTDLMARLRHICEAENLDVEDSLFTEISRAAQGGLRDAVMLLDQVTRVGVRSGQDFNDFFGIRNYSVPLMWAALRGDYAEGYRLVAEHFSRTGEAAAMVADLSRLIAELLVIKSEGRPKNHSESALQERVEMAQAVTTESLVQVCEILWQLRPRTRPIENDQRSAMEMAFALIANSVRDYHPDPEPAQPVPEPILREEPSHEKMTLAEIVSISTGR